MKSLQFTVTLLNQGLQNVCRLVLQVPFMMLQHSYTAGDPSQLPLHVDVVPNFQLYMSKTLKY